MPMIDPREGHVLVIGAAGIDIKGRPDITIEPGIITPGKIQFGLGGVARNIAETLARLEVPTVLLTAIGDDANGQIMRNRCGEAGIDVSHFAQIAGQRTGSYIRLSGSEHDLDLGIFDYGIVEYVTP